MNIKRQSFVLIVIYVAIAAIAFFAGQHLIGTSKNKKLPLIYQGALPSIGPLVTVQKIKVSYDGDTAIATLQQKDLDTITIGQKVVLYDDEKTTMPLGGKINRFTSENNQIKAFIELPEGTNTEFLSNIVGVITQELRAIQRLPLDILQTDKEGGKFIWIAQLDNAVALYKLIKHPITIGAHNGIYFEPQALHHAPEGLIIINPDNKINPDTHYMVTPAKIDAPLHNPIHQAWIDFELYRLEVQQARLIKQAEDCVNGVEREPITGDSSSGSSNSCGGNTDPNDIMFQVFQSLTQPADAGGGNACGSSCGQ